MNNKSRIFTALSVTAALLQSTQAAAHINAKDSEEKCYGVVKAGKNDCASKANKHSCATMAKNNADANEWMLVPKGLCEKLANGSLSAKE